MLTRRASPAEATRSFHSIDRSQTPTSRLQKRQAGANYKRGALSPVDLVSVLFVVRTLLQQMS
jgi:hypothetical protein